MVSCKAFTCVVLAALAVAGGIALWQLAPWDDDDKTDTTLESDSCVDLSDCCNGLQSNCDLRVNEVLFPTVHNAMSSADDGFIAPNNNKPLEDALVAGYRGLMLDSCICTVPNELKFCHTFCSAGTRDPVEVFESITKFLTLNPTEVVIVFFQINDNSLDELYETIESVDGLLDFVYKPAAKFDIQWPLMRTLVEDNTRLLMFASNDDIESCKTFSCPDGLLYKYDSMFVSTDVESCDISRDNTIGGSKFFFLQHWTNNALDLPDASAAEVNNAYAALESRVNQCPDPPSLVAVDFWDVGDLIGFAEDRNKARASGGTVDTPGTGQGNVTVTDNLETGGRRR